MATTSTNLSAAVTRILILTGFPKELKTKDIQTAFSDFEGFKIKWIDDTSLYVVFNDAVVAKRAYLRIIASPPTTFYSEATDTSAVIRPYDGPDAQTVIQAINSRQQSTGTRRSASISVPSARGAAAGRPGHATHASMIGMPQPSMQNGGPPSPSLPDLPSHPTLDALIDASLNAQVNAPPRLGDPGKRMIGHALGVRHPSLPQRNGANGAGLPAAMGGLTIAE